MAASTDSASKATIGILSIGDMGMGIAKLLRAHDYTVLTVAAGRSQQTIDRIKSAKIVNLPNDEALVAESDIIFSIVPPRDAIATAKRISDACKAQSTIKYWNERRSKKDTTTETITRIDGEIQQKPGLIYIDFNAISPRTAKTIGLVFSTNNAQNAELKSPSSPNILTKTFSFQRTNTNRTETESNSQSQIESNINTKPIHIHFLDGGIIGGPPRQNNNNNNNNSSSSNDWTLPSLIISGPEPTPSLTSELKTLLNMTNLSNEIGTASTLKSCFASLTKGLTALSILSFTTAHQSNVLSHLTSHLEKYSPATLTLAQKGLTGMPPKAYRWVDEMLQIGETFSTAPPPPTSTDSNNNQMTMTTTAAFPPGQAGRIFEGISEVYRFIAEETELGKEKSEKRKRGKDITDVAECVRLGLVDRKVRRRKNSSAATGGGSGVGGGGSSGTNKSMVRRGSKFNDTIYDDDEIDDEGKLDQAWRGSWA